MWVTQKGRHFFCFWAVDYFDAIMCLTTHSLNLVALYEIENPAITPYKKLMYLPRGRHFFG
jgi:hypothetical protein